MNEVNAYPPQSNGPAEFPAPKEVGPRQWGKEIMLFVVPGSYTFKKLEMNKGTKGGLQYHHKKDEGGYIVSGELLVRYDPKGDGNLVERKCVAGDVVHFPQGAVHQEEALTDCVIIEVSTPFLNDRVRVEEMYGMKIPPGGLPSTKIDEVTDAS